MTNGTSDEAEPRPNYDGLITAAQARGDYRLSSRLKAAALLAHQRADEQAIRQPITTTTEGITT